MKVLGSTYFFHMGGRTKGLITQDLEIIQHVLQKNHKNYIKSPLQTEQLASYVGNGLLTNNGESWLRQRRLIQPAFTRKNINSLSFIIEEEAKKVFHAEIGQGGPTNISHVAAMLTFHVVARAIFSDEMSHDEIVGMRRNVERVQHMIIHQVRQPYKRWYYRWSGKMRRHHALADEAKDLIKSVIINRKANRVQKKDILQFLLDTRYEDTGEEMELAQLVDELLILMVAGHETTAHSFSWTLFLLNQHEESREKLLEDIRINDENYLNYFLPDSYVMAVIKESMRLYPPAWVIDRIGLKDDFVTKNKTIPGNTIIMSFIYGLHRDPKFWPDPDSFVPERFLSDTKQEAYFPFGAGPRLCIGNHFAYLELIIAFVQFFKNYRLPLTPISHPGIKPLITLQPAHNIWMDLIPFRKEEDK
jgi:cytochrome P450